MRLSLFAGLLLCAACQPTKFFQAYPGPMRPPAEHPVVALPPEDGTALTAISCVDGQREPAPIAYVLPDRHYLTVLFIRGRYSIEGPALAGRGSGAHVRHRLGGFGGLPQGPLLSGGRADQAARRRQRGQRAEPRPRRKGLRSPAVPVLARAGAAPSRTDAALTPHGRIAVILRSAPA